MLELGGGDLHERGFVEIGAGNGQWARILTDRYNETTTTTPSSSPPIRNNLKGKQFHFVLAYDDQSDLPLNPDKYNKNGSVRRNFFFDGVQKGSDTEATLRHWQCRGRILLLVFPPPGPMAVTALRAYAEADAVNNDTLVYVGEGRGGANANDDFFNALEGDGGEDWILTKMLPVKRFGNKSYEKLFVFKRNRA